MTFKKTWGESITAGVSTGLVFFGIFAIWLFLFIFLALAGLMVNPLLVIPVIFVFFLGLILIALVSSAVSNIYRLLLYLYAKKGVLPPGFSEEEVRQFFVKK